jgi:hypothetical protein
MLPLLSNEDVCGARAYRSNRRRPTWPRCVRDKAGTSGESSGERLLGGVDDRLVTATLRRLQLMREVRLIMIVGVE